MTAVCMAWSEILLHTLFTTHVHAHRHTTVTNWFTQTLVHQSTCFNSTIMSIFCFVLEMRSIEQNNYQQCLFVVRTYAKHSTKPFSDCNQVSVLLVPDTLMCHEDILRVKMIRSTFYSCIRGLINYSIISWVSHLIIREIKNELR